MIIRMENVFLMVDVVAEKQMWRILGKLMENNTVCIATTGKEQMGECVVQMPMRKVFGSRINLMFVTTLMENFNPNVIGTRLGK